MCSHRVKIGPLISKLEMRTEHRRRDTEYAEDIGISRHSFKALMEGDGTAVRYETIDKLVCFFDRHGMPVSPGDLFSQSN